MIGWSLLAALMSTASADDPGFRPEMEVGAWIEKAGEDVPRFLLQFDLKKKANLYQPTDSREEREGEWSVLYALRLKGGLDREGAFKEAEIDLIPIAKKEVSGAHEVRRVLPIRYRKEVDLGLQSLTIHLLGFSYDSEEYLDDKFSEEHMGMEPMRKTEGFWKLVVDLLGIQWSGWSKGPSWVNLNLELGMKVPTGDTSGVRLALNIKEEGGKEIGVTTLGGELGYRVSQKLAFQLGVQYQIAKEDRSLLQFGLGLGVSIP